MRQTFPVPVPTRRRAGLIVLAGVLAAGAFLAAPPQFANAEVRPPDYHGCRPDDPKCNPFDPPPVVYQAVGRDSDEAVAQSEAEDAADMFCARGYKKVKALITEQGDTIVYTLTYTCVPPQTP